VVDIRIRLGESTMIGSTYNVHFFFYNNRWFFVIDLCRTKREIGSGLQPENLLVLFPWLLLLRLQTRTAGDLKITLPLITPLSAFGIGQWLCLLFQFVRIRNTLGSHDNTKHNLMINTWNFMIKSFDYLLWKINIWISKVHMKCNA